MTTSRLRVVLIVDNPLRDLSGIVLVAQQLCAHGAVCYLAPLNLEWWEVGALAPDFVLLTNIRRTRQDFAHRLLEAGIQVGVLECEGGVMPSFETYETMLGPSPDLFKRISCVCVWGPRLARVAVDRGWYEERQVTVTGAPRFDLYAPGWRLSALESSPDVENVRTPFILVNGSFPRANPKFVTPEREIESAMRLGFNRDYLVRFQSAQMRGLVEMVAVANRIAERFPDTTVIYRPHPFERVETYEPLLDRRGNLKLLQSGTVEGWILRAACVVHSNSTTAIEAAIAGVPTFVPAWVSTAEKLDACDAVSTHCHSFDNLASQLALALEGRVTIDANGADVSRVIADWFYRIDGESHRRVAEAILSAAAGAHNAVSVKACRDIHYGKRPGQYTLRSWLG
ncbi:MAG: surface carbohydrate biosynthesis protein, partial [Vicinamibacterales bacterium]